MYASTRGLASIDARDAFSDSYASASARVRAAAARFGASSTRFPIAHRGPDGEELAMDAIRIGDPNADRVVVVSSGLHGVEGFLGSAVQNMLLHNLAPSLESDNDPALILLHAVNPYGFAWLRRVNENNVDLNRNFPTHGQRYQGCPDGYWQVDDLINPKSAPQWDFFYPRVAEKVVRFGFDALKQAVVNGQYECPQGLFYGGDTPNSSVAILEHALPELIGSAEQVLHVDIHTGLGRWGEFKLLLDAEGAASESDCWQRFSSAFPSDRVEAVNGGKDDNPVVGSLGEWCRERFSDCTYDVVCAEFGTYPALKVLAALREENRAHHWGGLGEQDTWRAKRILTEIFAPRHSGWRSKAVHDGVAIVARAVAALQDRTLH